MVIDWKETITILEKKRDWRGAINLLQNSDNITLDVHLRVMFLLVFYLAEGQYSTDDYNYISINLREIYNKTKNKYIENSQFLFYTAIIMYIGEWYFGIDDIEFVNQMLKKASDMESNNMLYKWGYYSHIDQRLEIDTGLKLQLSEQLLFKEPTHINLLKEMGLLGEYIIGTLEATYKDLKSNKVTD